jgi:hypothetical protein
MMSDSPSVTNSLAVSLSLAMAPRFHSDLNSKGTRTEHGNVKRIPMLLLHQAAHVPVYQHEWVPLPNFC